MLPALLLNCLVQAPLKAPALPKTAPAVIGRRIDCRVIETRVRRRWKEEGNDTIAFLRNGRRTFKPLPGYERAGIIALGSDQSVAILYSSTSGLSWTFGQSIYYRGRLAPIKVGQYFAGVDKYVDRNNYAGSYMVKDQGADRFTLCAPTAYVVQAGKATVLGPGTPVAWMYGHDVLASVPVDRFDAPSGDEFAVAAFLLDYQGGAAYDLGRLKFLGRKADGALILSKDDESSHRLFEWKAGRFSPLCELPKGWTPVLANHKGEVFARFETPRDGTDDSGWRTALLQGLTLHPLRFQRPSKSKRLLWGETAWFGDDDAVVFHAYFGAVDRDYKMIPRRRSLYR